MFSSVSLVCRVLSVGETSYAPRKKGGKYCAAFDCNNSAYDVNGTRTSYHFFEFPKDAQQRNRWCSLIKRRHGRTTLLFPPPLSSVMSIFGQKISRKNFLVPGI